MKSFKQEQTRSLNEWGLRWPSLASFLSFPHVWRGGCVSTGQRWKAGPRWTAGAGVISVETPRGKWAEVETPGLLPLWQVKVTSTDKLKTRWLKLHLTPGKRPLSWAAPRCVHIVSKQHVSFCLGKDIFLGRWPQRAMLLCHLFKCVVRRLGCTEAPTTHRTLG